MHIFLAFEIGEGCAELERVENECGKVQPRLVALKVGTELSELGQLHHDPDGRV